MAAFDHINRAFRSAAGSRKILVGESGSITLKAARASNYTTYIDSIDVVVETSAARTITFEDSASSPTFVEATDSAPGANTKYHWEWPGGKALAEGKDFLAVLSGAGLVAHVQWTGTFRKTS
jgi:hypothetical protein